MKTMIGSFAVLALAVSAFAQQLTDDQVRQAITRGSGKPHQIGLTLNDKQTAFLSSMQCHTCAESGYTITVYNPEQWIEFCAAQAKKEMQPFTLADVTEQMRAQELHVVALPSRAKYLTGDGISRSSSVHRVVLNDTAKLTIIQPLEVRQNTLQGDSALRSIEQTMASADFSMSDVATLRKSDLKGEFFVVVVGDNQNKFFKVKSKDMDVLFSNESNAQIATPNSPIPAPAFAPVRAAIAPTPAEGPRPETVSPIKPQPMTLIPATQQVPAETAKSETVSSPQSMAVAATVILPTPPPSSESSPTAAPATHAATAPSPRKAPTLEVISVESQSEESESVADAARRMKQRKSCLELAKDNPGIICK